jgi:UDP-N-acetylglucosamine--N-acetylmuramyl-(pentapeptide) pyrophosphoryl-undecaprenol N-acetylglucosamine transferase
VNVVFAGGGTGGHLYPAIAIAGALQDRAKIDFIGTADRLEATIVPHAGYSLHAVSARPFARRFSFDFVRTVFANAIGTLQSIAVLRKLRPDVTIATGGYVCFPVVLAARVLRAVGLHRGPIALLEPNARPGLTNRMLAPLVDEVWGAFPEPDARFAGKYAYTGVPVRRGLRSLPSRDEAVERLGLAKGRKILLAMGGSQGARTINDALAALVRAGGVPAGWQLVHVTGEQEYDRVRRAIGGEGGAVRPYLHDVTDAYAAADLVLARAGASTLGELAAVGLPSILVPYPYAAENHQAVNAERFRAAGASVVVADRELDAGRLRAILAEIVEPERLSSLREGARRLSPGDPVATVLARIDALRARRDARKQ